MKKILFLVCGLLLSFFAFNQVLAVEKDDVGLIKFSSNNNLLTFGEDGVMIFSGSNMVKSSFYGANKDLVIESNYQENEISPLTKVIYRNVWTGTDVVYEASEGALMKSTYFVDLTKEGVSPLDIKLQYNRPVAINSNGDLIVSLDRGYFSESAPVAWQENDNGQIEVPVSYFIGDNNVVSFELGDYDQNLALVIDPRWNTFLGGEGYDGWNSAAIGNVAIDDNGDIFISGYSIASWGESPVRNFTSGIEDTDGFLAKLNYQGDLIWHTFLGGGDYDDITGFALGDDGNIYVAGYSEASWGDPIVDFTTPGDGESNRSDIYLAKLNSQGELIWNTFVGGSHLDAMASGDTFREISLDDSNNIYLAGNSWNSWGNPIVDHSGGREDTFIVKLNSSGVSQWHTFLGGAQDDILEEIVVGSSDDIYLAGRSAATWGASPIRAYVSGIDVFVAKLNSSGVLQWNTFLGGTGTDLLGAAVLSVDGNLYVAGKSSATWGDPIRAYTLSDDAFIAKLNSSGVLQWNTFLGGTGSDDSASISFDTDNNIYLIGKSAATWGDPIRAYTASNDVSVVKLNSSGALQWNTFLGGAGNDSLISLYGGIFFRSKC